MVLDAAAIELVRQLRGPADIDDVVDAKRVHCSTIADRLCRSEVEKVGHDLVKDAGTGLIGFRPIVQALEAAAICPAGVEALALRALVPHWGWGVSE